MRPGRKTVVIMIALSAICILAVLAPLIFRFASPGRTTDTWSFSIKDQEKKLSFLAAYLTVPSEILDAEYHIDYQDNATDRVPGPSDWDIRVALKIEAEDIPLWTEGFLEIPADEIDFTWWDGLATDNITWDSDGFLCYKSPEGFSYLVVFPGTGIILKSFSTMALYPPEDKVVIFTEPVIESAARELLDKPEGDITETDLLGIHVLGNKDGHNDTFGDIEGDIETLEDLRYFKNLNKIVLSGCNIESLSGIEGLTNLKTLYVRRNRITSIEPLRGLVNIVDLDIADNDITDLSPLAGLTKLERLCIDNGSEYTDITPLKNLLGLQTLYAPHCGIDDISALSGLHELTYLQLLHNHISDISLLKDLTKLHYLGLGNNQISDISPIENHTALTSVHLDDNPIPEDVLERFYAPKQRDYFSKTFTAKINKDMPAFRFVIAAHNTKIDDCFLIDSIKIVNTANEETIQEIFVSDFFINGQVNRSNRDTMDFELMDLNFDGYEDIRLFDTFSGTYLIDYLYFVWDTESRTFKIDRRLNELPLPTFDQEKQVIYTMSRGSAVNHYYKTYKYVNGDLVVIEEAIEVSVYFKEGVDDDQIQTIVPEAADYPITTFVYMEVKKQNDSTMEMDLKEAKIMLYIPNEWTLITEFDADSDQGKRLSEIIDWDRTKAQ